MPDTPWRIVFSAKGPVHYLFWCATTYPQALCSRLRTPMRPVPSEERRHCRNCERILASRRKEKNNA